MPGLRGLDLHFYEDVGSHVLREAAVQHIGHCKNLAWLDISLWGMSEHQVNAAAKH